jgi:hypothetical protein
MLALLYLSYYQIKDMMPSFSLTHSFSFFKNIVRSVVKVGKWVSVTLANPSRVGFDYISCPPYGSGREQALRVLARAAQVTWMMINWVTVR